jgi:phosphotriesterase-related protein
VRIFPTQLLAYDFQLLDPVLVTEEIKLFVSAVENSSFVSAGKPGLVDLSSGPRMGRNPKAMLKLAEQLDVHLVMSCGWYREPWFDPDFERRSVGELTTLLIAEIENGVEATGIRPGIIGELGTDRDFVSPAEERVLRAAARAHRKTDLSITLHARASKVALAQLEVLVEEGVNPGRVIAGHTDSYHDPDYHEELARIGAWVEFDTIRGKFPYVVDRSVRYVMEARRRGFLNKLLLSGDVCALSHLHAHGGTGYDYLPALFSGALSKAGLSDEELLMLFVYNPRRALTGSDA